MATTTIKPEHSKIYYIIYSEDLLLLFNGSIEVGNVLTTGQPNIEEFSNEEEMNERLSILNVLKNGQ